MTPEQIKTIEETISAINSQLYSDWYHTDTMRSFEEWCEMNWLYDQMKELQAMVNAEYDKEN